MVLKRMYGEAESWGKATTATSQSSPRRIAINQCMCVRAPFSADRSGDSGLAELFLFSGIWAAESARSRGDSREASYLCQRIAVTTQRFSSVLFRDSFVPRDNSDA